MMVKKLLFLSIAKFFSRVWLEEALVCLSKREVHMMEKKLLYMNNIKILLSLGWRGSVC